MTAGRGKEIEMTIDTRSATLRLADHTLGLRFEGLPAPVVQRTKELFLDFLGVALGGRLAESTGPSSRPSLDCGQASPARLR